MSAVSSSPRDLTSSVIAFLPRMARAKWAGAIALLVGLLGTVAAVLSTHRLYRSEAVVMYEPGAANVASGGGESPRQVSSRLQDMVASHQRLEGIVRDLNLYPSVVERRGIVEAVEEMRARLKVTGREGYTFRISFDIDSRERSQEVLAYLLKSILDDDAKRRQKESLDARTFLDTERLKADTDLKEKESALATFLGKHPQLAGEVLATGGTIRANEKGAGSSSGELASLEMQGASIEEALSAALRQPIAAGPRAPVSLDPVIAASQARTEADLHAAERDLAEKQARFTDEHPDVKAAAFHLKQAQAAARQTQLAANASLAANPATTGADPVGRTDESASNASRVGALRRALAAVRSQISAVHSRAAPPKDDTARDTKTMVSVDTEWTQLARAVAEAHERQQQIESKQFQAQLLATLVAGNQAGGLVITDPPFKPMRPVAGGRFKIAAAGLAVSLFLALVVLVLAGFLDRRVYDAHDVVQAIHADIVVVVPRLMGKSGGKSG
jgi:hypothetical protein